MPSPTPRAGATWRERGVLLLGLVSALVLVVAAFLPANDPETVARTALAQLAARTEQAAVDEWQRMLRDPAPIAAPASETFVHAVDALPAVAPDPDLEPALDLDSPTAAALLAEAEGLQYESGEAEEFVALATEALEKRPSRVQRVSARLLLLREALDRGERTRAVENVKAILSDFEERDARLAVLGAWVVVVAASLASDPDAFSVLDASTLIDVEGLIAAYPARLARIDAPRTWYWIEGLEPLAALHDRLPAADFTQAGEIVFRELPMLARLRALEQVLPQASAEHWTTHWNVDVAGSDLFARGGMPNGDWTGFFVTRDDLGAALVLRMHAGALLPDGMELDFDGGRVELGTELRARVALLGDAFAFTLRHRDPEALVRSQSRRQTWVRVALVAMAAFAAGAGFAMARALRRERKLAELKSTFIANVSHELRTPLASILLMAENLESGRTRDPAAAARYHGLIRREALRLARLVDDVLDFSRLERGRELDVRREDVDARAVVDEWCSEFRAWAVEHGTELVLDVRELPPSVALDRDALRRALFNLLDNARKHSGSKHVRFEAFADAGTLVLRVGDTGRGIPLAKRANVFELFERLHASNDGAPGTGLGLAIVKEIVLAHGGTIAIRDPEQGAGTLFEIRLPSSSPERAEKENR